LHNNPKTEVIQGVSYGALKKKKKKNSGLLQNKLKTAVHSGIKVTWLKEEIEEFWSIAQ
jgi:hypothetical protein